MAVISALAVSQAAPVPSHETAVFLRFTVGGQIGVVVSEAEETPEALFSRELVEDMFSRVTFLHST